MMVYVIIFADVWFSCLRIGHGDSHVGSYKATYGVTEATSGVTEAASQAQ
jgi:hypothetical protein